MFNPAGEVRAVDDIVTAPFDPVAIVTAFPAIKYEVPSTNFVRDPVRPPKACIVPETKNDVSVPMGTL
ncbi:MAG: hypothetical protein EB113_06205, partial [Actinobacteria bacterium]|nr:hypothetical protein [Actinomycetota bacterium]